MLTSYFEFGVNSWLREFRFELRCLHAAPNNFEVKSLAIKQKSLETLVYNLLSATYFLT